MAAEKNHHRYQYSQETGLFKSQGTKPDRQGLQNVNRVRVIPTPDYMTCYWKNHKFLIFEGHCDSQSI